MIYCPTVHVWIIIVLIKVTYCVVLLYASPVILRQMLLHGIGLQATGKGLKTNAGLLS